MNVIINGEKREFAEGILLTALVKQLGMNPERLAIELNGDIVPRSLWPETLLRDGDRLEIVHFVGGGKARHRVIG
jgi:thiamine biosynthesis protein ThiS